MGNDLTIGYNLTAGWDGAPGGYEAPDPRGLQVAEYLAYATLHRMDEINAKLIDVQNDDTVPLNFGTLFDGEKVSLSEVAGGVSFIKHVLVNTRADLARAYGEAPTRGEQSILDDLDEAITKITGADTDLRNYVENEIGPQAAWDLLRIDATDLHPNISEYDAEQILGVLGPIQNTVLQVREDLRGVLPVFDLEPREGLAAGQIGQNGEWNVDIRGLILPPPLSSGPNEGDPVPGSTGLLGAYSALHSVLWDMQGMSIYLNEGNLETGQPYEIGATWALTYDNMSIVTMQGRLRTAYDAIEGSIEEMGAEIVKGSDGAVREVIIPQTVDLTSGQIAHLSRLGEALNFISDIHGGIHSNDDPDNQIHSLQDRIDQIIPYAADSIQEGVDRALVDIRGEDYPRQDLTETIDRATVWKPHIQGPVVSAFQTVLDSLNDFGIVPGSRPYLSMEQSLVNATTPASGPALN